MIDTIFLPVHEALKWSITYQSKAGDTVEFLEDLRTLPAGKYKLLANPQAMLLPAPPGYTLTMFKLPN